MNTYILLTICGVLLAVAIYLLVRLLTISKESDKRSAELLERISADVGGAERERRRAEEILERMSEGVLVLDEALRPVVANRSARKLLGLQGAQLPQRLPSDEILTVARRALADEAGAQGDIGIWFPERAILRVRAAPLGDLGGVVVVLQDVTSELRTQQTRKEFVAHASHELKSPVASLQTLAEAIRDAAGDDPAAIERFSQRLVVEAERLGRLIEDLLDLSRLEDPESLPHEEIDLSAVCRSELAAAADRAAVKDLALGDEVNEGIWVKGDEQHLALMVRNLLDNAIRYTGAGGDVSLALRFEDGEARMTVSDSGMGIPLDAQERVFERFYRVDRARSRDRGGTGLGLAIVKHAVELHGGRIDLESELGRGSRFIVHLPASVTERASARPEAG